MNTVVRRGDALMGERTDGEGFVDALRADEGFDPAGRRCVVVGAGARPGRSSSPWPTRARPTSRSSGRTAEPAEAAATLAGRSGRAGTPHEVDGADLVVNATPVGNGRPLGRDGEEEGAEGVAAPESTRPVSDPASWWPTWCTPRPSRR